MTDEMTEPDCGSKPVCALVVGSVVESQGDAGSALNGNRLGGEGSALSGNDDLDLARIRRHRHAVQEPRSRGESAAIDGEETDGIDGGPAEIRQRELIHTVPAHGRGEQ
jgi:hypothetical protein